MPAVNNHQMSVDAKLKHFISSLINQSDASAEHIPMLYHPSRGIIIAEVIVEVTEQFATAGQLSLSDGTDIDGFAVLPVATGIVAGDFTTLATFARGILGRRIAPGVKCIPYHTQVAAAGEGHIHIWYYLDDSKSDMEVN